MKKIVFAVIITGCISIIFGQHPDAGTTAFPFLNNSYDAQSLSMAGAAVGVPNGLYGVFSNPAVLAADIKKSEIFLGYNLILDGVWGGPIAFSRSYSKYGVFAIELFSATSGKITETTAGPSGEYQETNNTVQSTFLTGGLSWGYKISEKLFAGVTLKGVYDRIVNYSSDGFAFDFGIQYRGNNNRLVCGLVVKNVGLMFNGYTKDSTYSFPVTIEGGISVVPRNIPQLRIALDIKKIKGDYLTYEPGIELNIYKKFLLMRLGYAFSQKDLENKLKALSGEDDPDYIKSNWGTLCVGAGLKTNIRDADVKIDFGLQFRKIIVSPAFIISTLIDI